jgi:hypothetical protein
MRRRPRLDRIRTQKLAIAGGIAVGVALTLAVVTPVVLIGSRDSRTSSPAPPAPHGCVTYTSEGDIVRDLRTGTRCEATGEAGVPNLLYTHTARGRYEAVFWSDELQVYGPASEAMTPTYFFKWWPRPATLSAVRLASRRDAGSQPSWDSFAKRRRATSATA